LQIDGVVENLIIIRVSSGSALLEIVMADIPRKGRPPCQLYVCHLEPHKLMTPTFSTTLQIDLIYFNKIFK
jgi:hypothetical protein